jgi:hypothetical protein
MFNTAAVHGEDVRFKKRDGKPLPYQIERWDNLAGLAEIWVKIDTVRPLNDSQYIIMTWGNGPAVDSSNGYAVFDTGVGYKCVYHMNDGSPTQNVNAAQPQFTATVYQGTTNPRIRTGSGMIANADSLTNFNFVTAGLLPTMQMVSVSAWVNPVVRTPWAKIICKPWSGGYGPYQVFSLETTGPKDSAIQFHVGLSNQFSNYAVSKDSLHAKTWTHLAGTYDGLTMRLYVNGVQAGSYTWTNSPIPQVPTNDKPWFIGGWDQQGNNETMTGKIDEARIYRGVWSQDYIKLSYENQRRGSAVLQFK